MKQKNFNQAVAGLALLEAVAIAFAPIARHFVEIAILVFFFWVTFRKIEPRNRGRVNVSIIWLWLPVILGSGLASYNPNPSYDLLWFATLTVFAFVGVIIHSLRGFKMKSMDYGNLIQLALSGLGLVFSLKGLQETPELIVPQPEDGLIAGIMVFFLIRWGSKGIKCFLPVKVK